MGWLMWCYQLLCLQLVLLHSLSCANLCSHDESSALLCFKQLFSFSNPSSSICSRLQRKMKYWKEGTDCCSWEGVTCDRVTSYVIGLDLSCSWLHGTIPSNSSLFLLSHLQKLNLAYNDFNLSRIPSDFTRFPRLTHLNLTSSNFSGQVPLEISHLSKLFSLDLSSNDLTLETLVMKGLVQNMSHLQELFLCSVNMSTVALGTLTNINLPSLMFLSLTYCELQGSFPGIFINLTQLYLLDLKHNSLLGPIPSGIGGLQNLAFISLNDNLLDGPIPSSITELVNLTVIDLSCNHLSGTVELYMFAKLKNLEDLYLSHNSLSMSNTIKVNSSFPKLNSLILSSCNINEFPEIFSTADNLQYLDLSDNKIHGHIPNWLFNISTLSHLILSYNFLTGIEQLPWKGLRSLDLRSNLLQGLLPDLPPFLSLFSLSQNNMTGAIPSSFCNLSSIHYLDLSNNSLSGVIPQCLGNSTSIYVLDLKMNNFHGSIPQTFANGSRLTTLNLNGNQLEGSLPPSLVNCVNLEVLDLGNNMINDTFPHWLATLPELQVLIVRSNRFYGPLDNSRKRLPFSKLRILDLSLNGFSGPLPRSFFEDFEAMMSGKNNGAKMRYMGNKYYQDPVVVTMKGIETKMERILTIFTTIYLSCNKFQGRIPDVVGKMNSLIVLNFSHNSLTGRIPVSLENLTELESLDLSSNRLEGKIPTQLTSLTSLSVMNLSYNQLAGCIPEGKQFNTFENKSYIGNMGLCGFPLLEKCNSGEAPEPEPTIFQEDEDTWSWFDWKIIMMGYGSGLVIGLSMGYIVFSTGKPWWFVSLVERKVIKLSGRRGRRRRN